QREPCPWPPPRNIAHSVGSPPTRCAEKGSEGEGPGGSDGSGALAWLVMPESSGYLRHPSLRGDTIAFVTEDDLWSVPAAGGVARRLTANLSEVSHPALSPDGRFVAFTSREEHHPEVYCMPAAGGPAARLTFLGATATVRGWTPDGRILFTSEAGQPFHPMIHPYAVPPEAGPGDPPPFGPPREVPFGRNAKNGA